MRRTTLFRCGILLALLVLSGLAISTFSLARASQAQLLPDPPTDQVVVKPKHGVAINTILSRYNASLLGVVQETNLYFLKLSTGQTAAQLLPTLNADPDLFYAEPNYYAEGAPNGGLIMFGAHRAPTAGLIMFGAHGTLVPTPPGGADQWAWLKIRLAEAQKISAGHGIIVAVLDTGMAPDHPLLSSSITAGYDFVGMTNGIYDTGDGLDADGDNLIDEDVGHGTHVSGIIVTEAPGVQIMPIRVLNSDGVGTYWEVAAGIRYAVDHGAKIINMSLSAPRLTPSLADALNYAASRGVVVVAAAGVGPGPNYPAAYSDRLAVLGVGASDQNDNIAWFSGGQPVDVDLFAPGVDIYSAFPYNGYGLGSGTSMAAPMVAGEAALLMSRYPNWNSAQIIQRVITKVDPIVGVTVGRIDLADALTTGLRIDYAPGDFGVPNDNHIKPRIKIVNNTPENIPLSQLKARYWYTSETAQGQTFSCDYASSGYGTLAGTFVRIPDNSSNKTSTSDTYLEIGFPGSGSSLLGGAVLELGLRMNKTDWTDYLESNDYSYDTTRSVPAEWNRITLYRNGALIWGVEPYIVPPTMPTHTATPTIIPSPTATLKPTLVPTATSLPTSTPVPTLPPSSPPPPAPPSAAPGSSLKLQYMTLVTGSSSQAISPHVILFNTGTTSVVLSEVKIRYWFTVDANKEQSYWCDYTALGCGNVTSRFVQMSVPRPGADFYLEIGFNSGAGSLAAGANTGPIQNRFSRTDWSAYTQTGDYSFDPAKTQFVDWTKITVYRNGVLVWGAEP